jgi:hypothetical protein
MKTTILFVALATMMCTGIQAQIPEATTDERVELLSIVFRLAGAEEYNNQGIAFYDNRVDSLFAPFKEHALIKYAAQIRRERSIGYDAVMSFAILTEIKDGKIAFIKNVTDGSLESRWTKKTAKQFLKLLNDFYKKSQFHDFYLSQQPLYRLAGERFGDILAKVDFNWFEKFYGKKVNGKFHLILSMCNGYGNYGPKVEYQDGTEDIFAIIGLWGKDSLGYPVYSTRILETVIHEYNHSYCNPLIDEFYPQMEAQAKKKFRTGQTKNERTGIRTSANYDAGNSGAGFGD